MAVTIALLNQKGGVGKSSLCYHLGGHLARQGSRVVLIDADPQGSTTQALIGPDATRALGPSGSMAALFGDDWLPRPADLARVTPFDRLRLVPASHHLGDYNVPRPERQPEDVQRAIEGLVESLAPSCDQILIDCPPNLYGCSWAALVAADAVLVPVQAEEFGSQGIAAVLDSIELVRARINPGLRHLGYLLTLYNARLAIHRSVGDLIRQLYAGEVFDAVMPLSTDFKEAIAARLPVGHYKPRSAAAKAVASIAAEALARLATPSLEEAA